jgi:hypothetical protein
MGGWLVAVRPQFSWSGRWLALLDLLELADLELACWQSQFFLSLG